MKTVMLSNSFIKNKGYNKVFFSYKRFEKFVDQIYDTMTTNLAVQQILTISSLPLVPESNRPLQKCPVNSESGCQIGWRVHSRSE